MEYLLHSIKSLAHLYEVQLGSRERSGSVGECLTRDLGAAGSSVTALCPWARHINPSLVLVQHRKTRPYITTDCWWDVKNQIKWTNNWAAIAVISSPHSVGVGTSGVKVFMSGLLLDPFRYFLKSVLIAFANSLEPDQARQNVGPDLDPNCWYSDSVPERTFEKVNFEKVSRQQQNHVKLPSMQEVP